MVNMDKIALAIASLPPDLRYRLFSSLSRMLEEARAQERTESEINEEVADTILVNLYSSLIEPLEMIENTLTSKLLKETSSFKIEFSEISFDMQLLDKTREFREEFWSLADRLGRREMLSYKGSSLNWKGENGR